jgi:hypothetical protein
MATYWYGTSSRTSYQVPSRVILNATSCVEKPSALKFGITPGSFAPGASSHAIHLSDLATKSFSGFLSQG